MDYRKYGKTGKMVSAIGFGGMRFLKEEYDRDISASAEVVKYAQKLGINYFDTAPGYCDDKSEIIMGEAFKQMTGEFYVSTKCGLWNARTADEARKMIEQSLNRLKVPKITFYNMWCIKTLDEYKEMIKKGGIYEGALKAKEEGLIEHICFTTHLDGEGIKTIVEEGLFEGVTLGYNAVNFAYRRVGIKACHAAGLAVTTMNPLGGGIIPEHPEIFSFIKGESDSSLPVAALKFILAQPEVTIALPGFSTIEQLEENVKAAENIVYTTDEALEEMANNLTVELNSLCTGCTYCDECPVEIPIPRLLDSYNEAILSKGDLSKVVDKLGNHWGIDGSSASKCIRCGKCERLCTQKLPIMNRLEEIANFVK